MRRDHAAANATDHPSTGGVLARRAEAGGVDVDVASALIAPSAEEIVAGILGLKDRRVRATLLAVLHAGLRRRCLREPSVEAFVFCVVVGVHAELAACEVTGAPAHHFISVGYQWPVGSRAPGVPS